MEEAGGAPSWISFCRNPASAPGRQFPATDVGQAGEQLDHGPSQLQAGPRSSHPVFLREHWT